LRVLSLALLAGAVTSYWSQRLHFY
jgi:hypothetical protein